MSRLPDFILVGGMRCGSTTLYRLLHAHPDVHMAAPKELHFFDQEYSRGLGWYQQHFAAATQSQVCGEATPTYMYNEEVVHRMCTTNPGSKYIAILRHPVTRAYSHYWMNRALGREELSFSEALEREEAGVRRGEHWGRYIRMSRYHEALTRLESFAAPGSLAVVILEELAEDPRTAWSSLCAHLGVESTRLDPRATMRHVNAFQSYRSLRLRRWTKRFPAPLRNAVGRFNVGRTNYPPITSEERHTAWSYLADDTARLESWLGRSIRHWRDGVRSH